MLSCFFVSIKEKINKIKLDFNNIKVYNEFTNRKEDEL